METKYKISLNQSLAEKCRNHTGDTFLFSNIKAERKSALEFLKEFNITKYDYQGFHFENEEGLVKFILIFG